MRGTITWCGAAAAMLAAACGAWPGGAGGGAGVAGPVRIGAAWPWASRQGLLYDQGVRMAVDEINAGGGIGGRPIEIVREDDEESLEQGRAVAQRLAAQPDLAAVIGHMQSYVSIGAAPIYELSDLVMLTPTATDPALTTQGHQLVFRMTVTDREIGRQMADVAARQGGRRAAVYYIRNGYGRALANAFEERAVEEGMTVADRQSYDANVSGGDQTMEQVLQSWRSIDLDTVFVAAEPERGAPFIARARQLGLRARIFGGDALGTPGLIAAGGRAVEGVIVPTVFHPDEPRAEVRAFTQAFTSRYGKAPDTAAALGYDAVRLLADAIRRGGANEGRRIAAALHETKAWPGVTGPVTFDDAGDLVARPLLVAVVRNGAFEAVPAAQLARAR